MAKTLNILGAPDSLRRFIAGSTLQQTPKYLNGTSSPLHNWAVAGGSAQVISSVIKSPSCNTLQVSPSSVSSVIVSLSQVRVIGNAISLRDSVRYLFHSLIRCVNPTTVFTTLTSGYSAVTPQTSVTIPDQFTACRSNIVTLSYANELPSSLYFGADAYLDIHIQIDGHGGNPIFMTFPSLIDADAWRFNSFMSSTAKYVPTMYRDIDETQNPEYPFFKLIDVLSHAGGSALGYYREWFRFEPDEFPSDADDNEAWTRSRLTDGSIARSETLPWMANIVGSPLIAETYATDPSTASTVGWQRSSYPLDMHALVDVNVVSTAPVTIETELVIVEKWTEVATASTAQIDISSALIDGATVGGYVVSAGDRVLLKHQSNTVENGIYIVASSGAASRSSDANASGEFATGKAAKVVNGIYASTYWAVSIPSGFTLDTDPVAFNQLSEPGVIDGHDLVDGDLVLLTNQNSPAENGVWGVTIMGAARHSSIDTSADLVDMTCFEVSDGDVYAGTLWRLYADRPLVLNTDPIIIFEVDRILDFKRSQVSTAMYGHAAASSQSIRRAAQRLLTGNRSVAISPNSPDDYYITVKTILSETPGVDEVDSWTACRVATTEDVADLNSIIAGAEIDGVTINLNDRVLVWMQNSEPENGIYVAGSSSSSRATDANDVAEFYVGKVVYIQEGTLRSNLFFALTEEPSIIDVTSIVFSQADTLGSSDAILKAIEPSRPIGFSFVHQTVNKFAFTFNSPSLGRLDQGVLR